MAYETTTLRLCHELTELGKQRYQQLLESEADRLLMRSKHKFLDFLRTMLNKLGISSNLIQRKYEQYIKELEDDRT